MANIICTLENNTSINTMQLRFSGIPSEEIRRDLKQHKWRWFPVNKAWQRQNTESGLEDARRFTLRYFPEAWEAFSEAEKARIQQEEKQTVLSDTKTELTKEDFDYAKRVIPGKEYANLTAHITADEEESLYYKDIIKTTSEAVQRLYATMDETINEDKSHPCFLHYFNPTSDWYISELNKDGSAFGYTVLNGDTYNAEWGYININELFEAHEELQKRNPLFNLELDLHINAGATIEYMAHKRYEELFPDAKSPEFYVQKAETPLTDSRIQHYIMEDNITTKHKETDYGGRQRDAEEDAAGTSLYTDRSLGQAFERRESNNEGYGLFGVDDGSSGSNIRGSDAREREQKTRNSDLRTQGLSGSIQTDVAERSGRLGNEEEPRRARDSITDNDGELPEQSGHGLQLRLTKKGIREIRRQCREILEKPDSEITAADRILLARYEGAGGMHEATASASGILSEFYTPEVLVNKVAELVRHYAPEAKSALEPASGTGRFATALSDKRFTMYELDADSARINRLLHPSATVINSAFQKQFFDEDGRVYNKKYTLPKYDLVIGNPPYGIYNDTYKGRGEGTDFNRYEEYFISRGLDSLKDDTSLLAMVVPSGFLNSAADKQKEIIAQKGYLIDAYRLPEDTFPTTQVGTDIVFMKRYPENYNGQRDRDAFLSGGTYFKAFPEKIMGEEKIRINKFGKEETYVSVHEGMSTADEIRRIMPSPNRSSIEQNKELSQEELKAELMYKDPNGIFSYDHILTEKEFIDFYSEGKTDPEEYEIIKQTDWQGKLDINELDESHAKYLRQSEKYVEVAAGIYMNRALYASGNIYDKIDLLNKNKNGLSKESYEKNFRILSAALPKPKTLSEITIPPLSTMTEEFTVERELYHSNYNRYGYSSSSSRSIYTTVEKIPLREDFILWATQYGSKENVESDAPNDRSYIADWTTANIKREDLAPNVSWYDIVNFFDKVPVIADRTSGDNPEAKRNARMQADKKRDARRITAAALFDRYIHEGLPEADRKRLEAQWNKQYNAHINADWGSLPVFIQGMRTVKDGKSFQLYRQQMKGASFLTQKGNGLLAYDVGVGKTAAGIAATVAQLQAGRAQKPLVMVPLAVYSKWVHDFKELFPNIPINELGNFSEENLRPFSDGNHGLTIPPGSISVCTYQAQDKLSFEDYNCESGGALFNDFAALLGKDGDTDAKTEQKIKDVLGSATKTKEGFVYFERTGFDHLTVDEAHNFKNLFTLPRPSKKDNNAPKRQANEFNGIGAGNPSNRALKMFAMTQLVQEKNNNRNVFMLTATPFSNNPLEVYSMLSYVGREALRERHIYNLYDFCAQYADCRAEWAVSAKGKLEVKQVMKHFNDVSSLQNLLKEYIDKVDANEAHIERPEKTVHKVELEMTEVQALIDAHERENMTDAKAAENGGILVAMTHMQTAMLSPALLDPADYPEIENFPKPEEFVECSPKLRFVCDTAIQAWKAKPECGQVIYLPEGRDSIPYMIDYLVRHGMDKNVIGTIKGGDSNEARDAVRDAFNDKGNPLKLVIGTKAMSEGIDLNGNSIALYDTMPGWNPTDKIQTEGRIWRQGNAQKNVHIVTPFITDSIDSLFLQKHDEKSGRINDLFSYKGGDAIDVSAINPEELKIDLIKDPVKKADYIIAKRTADLLGEAKGIDYTATSLKEILIKRDQCEDTIRGAKSSLEYYEEQKGKESDTSFIRSEIAYHKKDISKNTAAIKRLNERLKEYGISDPETGVDKKLDELKSAYKTINEQIKHIADSKAAVIAEETAKNREKRLKAKSVTEQSNDLAAYIIAHTEYRQTYEATKTQENKTEVVHEVSESNTTHPAAITETTTKADKENTQAVSFTHKKLYEQMSLFGFEDVQKNDSIQETQKTSDLIRDGKERTDTKAVQEVLFSSDYMRRNLYLPDITGKTQDGNYTVSCTTDDLVKPGRGFNNELTQEALRHEIDVHIRRDLVENNGKLTVANEASSPYYNELIKPVLTQYDTKQKCMEKIIAPIVQKKLSDICAVLKDYADVQEGKELLAKVSEMTAVIQKKNGAAITVNKKEKPMGRVQNELDIW